MVDTSTSSSSEGDSASESDSFGLRQFDYCFIECPLSIQTWMDIPMWWKWQVLHWVFNDGIHENGSIWMTCHERGVMRVWYFVRISAGRNICLS